MAFKLCTVGRGFSSSGSVGRLSILCNFPNPRLPNNTKQMVKDRSKSREEDDAENNGASSKKARSGSKSKRKVEEEVEELDSESGSGSDDDGSRRSEEGRKRKRSRGSKRRSRRKYSDDDDSYSSSSADKYSDSGDSHSDHSSEDSETEEERRRRKRKERKRREERDKEKRRRRKDKEKKRRRKERDEDDRKLKKKKKKRDHKHKDKKDSERGKKGAVTNSWGKYGIIRETDMWNKRPEFTAWLAEVKQVNLESLPNWEEKQMFKEFMEDHNTTTFPSKKYYNLDAYFKRKIEKEIKKGIKKAPKTEMTVFNDEEQRRLELLQERERHKEEQVEALKRSMQGGMAQAMKEQAQLREEMAYHFRVGNLEAGAAIQRRLDPDVAM